MDVIYRTKRVKEEIKQIMPTVLETKGTFIFVSVNMRGGKQYLFLFHLHCSRRKSGSLLLVWFPPSSIRRHNSKPFSSKVTSVLMHTESETLHIWGQILFPIRYK